MEQKEEVMDKDSNDYEKEEGTLAYFLKKNWESFCEAIDFTNEKSNLGMVDNFKLRDFILFDMKRRNEEEKKRFRESQEPIKEG